MGWEGESTKGKKLTSGVHYHDCGDDFIDVNICQSLTCTLLRDVSFWF